MMAIWDLIHEVGWDTHFPGMLREVRVQCGRWLPRSGGNGVRWCVCGVGFVQEW